VTDRSSDEKGAGENKEISAGGMRGSGRRPEWLKVRLPSGETYFRLRALMKGAHLHTVCESALCPNVAECWGSGTATFLILGSICTRRCLYCAVKSGTPGSLDWDEPGRVAEAVRQMNLRHAVITSVTRDDVEDGGAEIFRLTIFAIREKCPGATIEVLVPDFGGRRESIARVVEARPEVFNHNVETVPRLYPEVRPEAHYERSLEVLRHAAELDPALITKSGIMIGMGEETGEILSVFRDLRSAGCRYLTVGQYLQPSRRHHPVARYYAPAEFEELKREAEAMGFEYVVSGPLVRSSYHATVKETAVAADSE